MSFFASQEHVQQKQSFSKVILITLAGSLLCFAAASAALASIMVKGNFSGELAAPFSLIALSLACFSAGWLSVKMLGHGILPCILFSYLIYGILPAGAGLVLEQLSLSMHLGQRLIILLLCSFAGALLGTQKVLRKKVH